MGHAATPGLKGHWKFEVYEGDIVRERLSLAQRFDNRLALVEARVLGRPLNRWHHGRILNPLVEILEGDFTPLREVADIRAALEGDNLVTTAGKSLLLDRLYANAGFGGAVNSMGTGTEATAAAIGDTKLNPAGGGTVFIQAFDAAATRAGLIETSICTFTTAQANFNWQELGEFNGTTNGTSTLFNRIAPIGPFNKTSAVSIVVTVTVTQS